MEFQNRPVGRAIAKSLFGLPLKYEQAATSRKRVRCFMTATSVIAVDKFPSHERGIAAVFEVPGNSFRSNSICHKPQRGEHPWR